MRAVRFAAMLIGALVADAAGAGALRQQTRETPTFRSAVDLVRVAAVVRDRKGRFVDTLTARDFEVLDADEPRPIVDFRAESAGISVALLFDMSGSMEVGVADAREAGVHLLSWLDASLDEAAVYMFDTDLIEVLPFTAGVRVLPPALTAHVPFGATSLHDAIARTARRVAGREGRRSGVVVLTDGNDNASRLTPAEAAAIASEIDVPVYVLGIVRSIDNPGRGNSAVPPGQSALTGPLSDLAAATGGRVAVASSPAERSLAARDIVGELRHQYFIAFESSGRPGWHPLVVRTRRQDLVVRARNGYQAGQSRPESF